MIMVMMLMFVVMIVMSTAYRAELFVFFSSLLHRFQDLCTVSELRAMEQRFEVASLLDEGMIYNEILERTGASSATNSRVNRSLRYCSGAYVKIFVRYK